MDELTPLIDRHGTIAVSGLLGKTTPTTNTPTKDAERITVKAIHLGPDGSTDRVWALSTRRPDHGVVMQISQFSHAMDVHGSKFHSPRGATRARRRQAHHPTLPTADNFSIPAEAVLSPNDMVPEIPLDEALEWATALLGDGDPARIFGKGLLNRVHTWPREVLDEMRHAVSEVTRLAPHHAGAALGLCSKWRKQCS